MATSDPVSPPEMDLLEVEIDSHFDRIIAKLNARRASLLTELRERREESRARDTQRKEMISQINTIKTQVEAGLKENPLKQMQQEMISKMENELEKLNVTSQRKVLKFSINTEHIEQVLETLGEIMEENAPVDYRVLKPIVAVAKKGNASGEFNSPEGVAVDENSGNIFVTEFNNSRVSVFSQTGKYLTNFGKDCFKNPWGIAIHNDNVFVSDANKHAIFLFKLPDMKLIRQVGKYGNSKLEFWSPKQICVSQTGDVFVCDDGNNRIQVLTLYLKFKRYFKHSSIKYPLDVKLTREFMYVLSSDNPCFHIFTLTGEKIRSIISEGEGLQVNNPLFFCFDSNANIVISCQYDHSIKIFTPEGELIHQIGEQGHEKGKLFQPRGIAFTKGGNLICVSDNENCGLQIFS